MEHVMLWTCLKTWPRPEKAILGSSSKLGCFELSWLQICPAQNSSASLEFAPIPSANEFYWKHCHFLPRFIETSFSFRFIQSSHLKSLARSAPDQRPQVHSQLRNFLIKLSVSLTSVSKLATSSLHPGDFAQLWASKWKPSAGSLFHNPLWVWPKPQSLGCKAVSGLLLHLAGKIHLKRTINTLLMCQWTDWSACWPKAMSNCCLPWCVCPKCGTVLIAEHILSLKVQRQMRGPPLISHPLH